MTETIIKSQKYLYYNFKELYEFKDTLFFLVWRDIKIKYKQTLLGFLWVVLQPLLVTMVFVLFGKATSFQLGDNNIPYPVFVFSGMIVWNLFSSAIQQTSNSVVNNAHIIKKIYFPRIFFPLSALLASSFDFLITFIVFLPLMLYYHIIPSIQILYILPLVYFLTSLLVLGIGSFFGALNVKYRDVKYVIPFLIQLLFFISPIFYTTQILTNPTIQQLYYLNPITGIIELFRHGLFNSPLSFEGILFSILTSLILCFSGLMYFRYVEHNFADIS